MEIKHSWVSNFADFTAPQLFIHVHSFRVSINKQLLRGTVTVATFSSSKRLRSSCLGDSEILVRKTIVAIFAYLIAHNALIIHLVGSDF